MRLRFRVLSRLPYVRYSTLIPKVRSFDINSVDARLLIEAWATTKTKVCVKARAAPADRAKTCSHQGRILLRSLNKKSFYEDNLRHALSVKSDLRCMHKTGFVVLSTENFLQAISAVQIERLGMYVNVWKLHWKEISTAQYWKSRFVSTHTVVCLMSTVFCA